MIGIGGIGMSGIAYFLLQNGAKVSGCDKNPNSLTEKLAEAGVEIFRRHDASHISSATDLVVYSSAIKENLPEILQASRLGIPVWKRAQMIASLTDGYKYIAVTGTHGKTTVSFMITHILIKAGLSPSFIIGGQASELGGNAYLGKGNYFVVEADESDGSMIYLKPDIAVITNIDKDHLEHYSSGITGIKSAMRVFSKNVQEKGALIGCGEDKSIREIMDASQIKTVSYGIGPGYDIYAENIRYAEWYSLFDVIYKKRLFCTLKLNVPGRHNILNALAGTACAVRFGVLPEVIKDAMSCYPSVKRRLEILLKTDKITVIDDYAHHPTEIRAVLEAARRFAKGRLIGVFQPHRFTRTKFLSREFAPSFKGLDLLILTDIYSAGEPPIAGISGKNIYDEALRQNIVESVYIEKMPDIITYLSRYLKYGDTVVVMGAGDITETAYRLVEKIKAQKPEMQGAIPDESIPAGHQFYG